MGTLSRLIVKRLGFGLVTILVISMLIAVGLEALPGDLAQAILGQQATPENVAAFRQQLGLDKPLLERYITWLGNFMQGDMGNSLANKREISNLIQMRLGNTLFLASVAAVVAVPLSLTLGVLAALYRETWFDKTASMTTLSLVSFPEFFLAYIIIVLLAVEFDVFPSISSVTSDMPFWDRIYAVTLPALTLILVSLAHMMRMTRAAIINLLMSAYIEMAHLKGIKRSRVIVHHALPNALSPIINIVALNLAFLVVGVVIVEVVFVYPGLGQLLVDSVSKRDLPVVQATGLIFAGCYVFLNLCADVASIIANPRMRHPK